MVASSGGRHHDQGGAHDEGADHEDDHDHMGAHHHDEEDEAGYAHDDPAPASEPAVSAHGSEVHTHADGTQQVHTYGGKSEMMKYSKFAAMIATSTVVMFGLMYLTTYAWDHVYFSETRAYMALVMGAAMAVVMLAFMLAMYTDRKINVAIFAGSAVVFVGALWLVRSQDTVGDVSWMRAMILRSPS
jgi:hypothetical protein